MLGIVDRSDADPGVALGTPFSIALTLPTDPRTSLDFKPNHASRVARHKTASDGLTLLYGGSILVLLVLGGVSYAIALSGLSAEVVRAIHYTLGAAAAGIVLNSLRLNCKDARVAPRRIRIAALERRELERQLARLKAHERVGRVGDRIANDLFDMTITPSNHPDEVLFRTQIRIPDQDYLRLGGYGAAIRAFYAPPPRPRWYFLLQPTALE